jgi:ceramide glucosyltransferase
VDDFRAYPVSILKPLKGVDSGLEANLQSFFELDYPSYELIFCVADARDPAFALASDLMIRNPQVRSRIFIGETEAGPNPKVRNMLAGYEAAAHDLVLISDSNVRVRGDYLKRMVPHAADPKVGLVTALVAGVRADGWGGALEAAFLNAFCARGMALAFSAGKPIVVGKSMLFSRKTAERFGGLRSLGRFLAEDFMAGEAMTQLGMKVVLMQDPVEQHLGTYSIRDFWSRHVRWGRIRKSQAPLIFPFELMQSSFCMGALGALAIPGLIGVTTMSFLVAHLSLWAICDGWLTVRISRARYSLRGFFAWAAREALMVPLFFQVILNNKVRWRGQTIYLRAGGIID